MAKRYRGKDVDVTFDKDLCIHAAECIRGLPEVFDVERRPWILPDKAPAEQVRDVVDRCPSGALEVHMPEASNAPAPGVRVTAMPGGPLIVVGACTVQDADGNVLKEGAKMALCRCGASGNKPFCDGSHGGAGFEG